MQDPVKRELKTHQPMNNNGQRQAYSICGLLQAYLLPLFDQPNSLAFRNNMRHNLLWTVITTQKQCENR
jgi:hypothetical protein